jgi:hypothetical protein
MRKIPREGRVQENHQAGINFSYRNCLRQLQKYPFVKPLNLKTCDQTTTTVKTETAAAIGTSTQVTRKTVQEIIMATGIMAGTTGMATTAVEVTTVTTTRNI